jgi:hypothetical protein
LNVPVLPVAAEVLPGQMLEHLHAVRMFPNELDRLRTDLSLAIFDRLVSAAAEASQALFRCAFQQEERSQLIARYARDVLALGAHGHVRQRGGLSAFSVPDNPLTNPVWQERFGSIPRNQFYCDLLRQERLALAEHARAAGCSLILKLSGTFDRYGPSVRKARLRVLRSFLDSLPDERVRAAVNDDLQHGDNLLLVGDWFVAAAASSAQGTGFRQTIFSRHAPTMRQRTAAFDEELDDLLSRTGAAPNTSRRAVIEAIDKVLAGL